MAILQFLDNGEKGENIRYCSNGREVPAEFVDEDDAVDADAESKKGRRRKL